MNWTNQPRSYEEIAALTVEEAMAAAGIDESHPCFGCALVRRACAKARDDTQESWSYARSASEAASEPPSPTGAGWSAEYSRASENKARSAQDTLERVAELVSPCATLAESTDEEIAAGVGTTTCRMVVEFGGRNPKLFAYNVVHGPMPSLTEE